jgi:Na+-transporting NADH:ubiquinone oxidoreductase subunit B
LLLTVLLYPLILPPGLPLWVAGVGIAFGLIVGKELFGAAGRYPLNPALVGRCFLQVAFAPAMAGGYVMPAAGWPGGLACWLTPALSGGGGMGPRVAGALPLGPPGGALDAVTAATPLAAARHGQFDHWAAMLLGTHAGSAGETSAVLIVLGALMLVVTGVANWRTIAATLGSFAAVLAVLAWACPASFGPLASPVGPWAVPAHIAWHLLAGGLLFGAVFLATDPFTAPASDLGKWLYGILIGAAAVLIRFRTGHLEGVAFAILLGNIAAPLLDALAARGHVWRLRHEG